VGSFVLAVFGTEQVTVNVWSTTKFHEPGVTNPGGFSDLQVGDKVSVTGTLDWSMASTGTSTGGAYTSAHTRGRGGPGYGAMSYTINASSVTIPLAHLTGTVSNLSTSGFTLTTQVLTGTSWTMPGWGKGYSKMYPVLTVTAATITVNLSSATKYTEPGVPGASWSNLANGDKVNVIGAQAGGTTVNALWVAIPAVTDTGTVQGTPSATGFTLTTARGGTVTVNTSSSTVISQQGGGSGATVQGGNYVTVKGLQAGTGTVNATSVFIWANAPSGSGGSHRNHHRY
jgi:hypothetical protein